MRYFPFCFSCSAFQTWWLFYIYNTSEIELDTFQVLYSHMWLMAANSGRCRCLNSCLVNTSASVVHSFRRVQLFATPWTVARRASLSFTISRSLLKLMSIESVMSSSHLMLCCPPLPASVFPSIRVFSNDPSTCI